MYAPRGRPSRGLARAKRDPHGRRPLTALVEKAGDAVVDVRMVGSAKASPEDEALLEFFHHFGGVNGDIPRFQANGDSHEKGAGSRDRQ